MLCKYSALTASKQLYAAGTPSIFYRSVSHSAATAAARSLAADTVYPKLCFDDETIGFGQYCYLAAVLSLVALHTGQLENKSVIHMMYVLPSSVVGSGPTQSICI